MPAIAETRPPAPVKLFCGMLGTGEGLLERARQSLEEAFGAIDSESDTIPFTFTDYYAAEMGGNLLRKFVSFATPLDPGALAAAKLRTNELERQLAAHGDPPRRRVNLDPGYITAAKVVLATTKNFAHRIYLGQGIFAEVTLNFDKNGCVFHPWTYPDFRSDTYTGYLEGLRARYLAQGRPGNGGDAA